MDHADQNRRNNSLANLRAATRQQNSWNKGPRKRKHTDLQRGVYPKPTKKGMRFQARARGADRSRYNLGTFDTAAEASLAFEDFVKPRHGEFYCPHPPPTLEGEG